MDELAKLESPEKALAVVTLLEKRRREERFICYWEPHKSQEPLFELFTPEVKTMLVRGGQRAGKTELGSFIAVAWALGKKFFEDEPAWKWVKNLPIPEPPNNIWVVCLDFPTLRDVIWGEKFKTGRTHPPFIPMIEGLVKPGGDADFQIRFANGSVITGKSAESKAPKFQGASIDLVWIDEEPERDIYDECFQRTADCRGKILVTLTPLTDIGSGIREPWVFELDNQARSGVKDVKVLQLSVFDNPVVPEDEKQRLRERWAGHFQERARLYGEFIQQAGLVYPMWNPTKHLVVPHRTKAANYKVVSIDPAPTGITAALWADIEPNGDIFLYREYYEADKVVSEHVKDILVANGGDQIDLWVIDPFGGRQRNPETHKTIVQLYRESGIPARLAHVDSDFGISASKEYLYATIDPNSRHPKVYVSSDLENFQSEIEHYVYAFFSRGPLKGTSKEKPLKGRDHLMNAWQYMAAMRPRARLSRFASMEERQKLAQMASYT